MSASSPPIKSALSSRAVHGEGFNYPARGPFYRTPAAIRAGGDQYRTTLNACEWEETSATVLDGLYYRRTVDSSGAVDTTGLATQQALRLRECHIKDAIDGDDSWWVIQRVGPLVSNGGDATHFISWNDAARVSTEIAKGGDNQIYFTGYVARSVSPTGEPLGNPPIHQHHAHLNPYLNPYAWFTGFFVGSVVKTALAAFLLDPWNPIGALMEVVHAIADGRVDQMHGDAQCHEAGGGLDCMMHRVPAPYGTPIHRPFFTDAMLEDVRVGGSAELTIWFESAIRMSRRKPSQAIEVSPLFRKTAAHVDATRPRLWGLLPDTYVTYRVPTNGNSYKADVQPVAPNQQWLIVANHMHRKMMDEQWLIIGHKVTPSALGLNWTSGGHELAFPFMTDGPGQPTSASIKSLLRANVAKLRANGEHVVFCIDDGPPVVDFKPTDAEYAFGLRAGEYDRFNGMYCDREGIVTSRSDEKTSNALQIAFHRKPSVDAYGPWFPMHATLHVQANGTLPDGAPGLQDSEAFENGGVMRWSKVLAKASQMKGGEVRMQACWCCLIIALLLAGAFLLCRRLGRACGRVCRSFGWQRVNAQDAVSAVLTNVNSKEANWTIAEAHGAEPKELKEADDSPPSPPPGTRAFK